MKYTKTSNKKLNVPMTREEWDVVSFLAFESETSIIYPFALDFDSLTMEIVSSIVEKCNGFTHDTETLYKICEMELGINKKLMKR